MNSMIVEKEKLEKQIKAYSDKIGALVPILAKDFADVLLFLAIYCGNQTACENQIELKMNGFESPSVENNFNKNGDARKVKQNLEKALMFEISSYDKSISLKIILSKKYIKIEKLYDTPENCYVCEYIFDERGCFVRKAIQKCCLLGKCLEFNETSQGAVGRGVCFCSITEQAQKMKVKFFKIQSSKGEEIYYSYFSPPDLLFHYRAPKTLLQIPSITSIGMKELNELLEKQFSKEFASVDEKLFKELEKSAKEIFKQQIKKP